MFGTPIAGLGSKVAVSAWTGNPSRSTGATATTARQASTCPSFTEKAFVAFRDTYRGKGPEGVPLSSDEPGRVPAPSDGEDEAGGGTRTLTPPRGHLVLSQARMTSFATPASARITPLG